MSCIFEVNNKVSMCKVNEDKKEVCSTLSKEQGYTNCVYIKQENNLTATEKAIKVTNDALKDTQRREKEIEKLIAEYPSEDILKDL